MSDAPQYELRHHSAMPNWCKVVGLEIKPVPKTEGVGFMIRRDQAEAIVSDATERARLEGEVARLREALEKVAAEFDAIGTLHAAIASEDARRISTIVKVVREALRHDPR